MKAKISPSLMCADFLEIKSVLKELEQNKTDLLHIDVMDGVFVPNIMLSNEVVKKFRGYTDIPFDYHLMIMNPLDKIDWFDLRKGDYLSIHLEATYSVADCLKKIRDKDAKAGLAINPDTHIEMVEPYLQYLDFILLMMVNPGFAGQIMIQGMVEKVYKMKRFLLEKGYSDIEIEVDGNITEENAPLLRKNGADIFVCGTGSIFRREQNLTSGILKIKEAISKGETQ